MGRGTEGEIEGENGGNKNKIRDSTGPQLEKSTRGRKEGPLRRNKMRVKMP